VLDHYVPAARELEDFSDVTAVGIDETAARHHPVP
jgi:transposase